MSKKPQLDGLTSLRALASVWVVLFHMGPFLVTVFPAFTFAEIASRGGYMGVDVFFVLSGFVLAYRHGREFRLPFDRLTPKRYFQFLLLRLARIYPAHIVMLGALVLVAAVARLGGFSLDQTGTPLDVLRQVLLVHGWGLASDLSWDGPSWSISAEWAAYLAFPVIAVLFVRRSAVAAVVLIAAALSVMLLVYGLIGSTQAVLTYEDPLPRVLLEFSAGVAAFTLWSTVERRGDRARRVVSLAGVLSCAALVAGGIVLEGRGASAIWLAPFVVPVVLAAAAPARRLGRLLSRRLLVRGGELSYSLYLVHVPVILLYSKLVTSFGDNILVRICVLVSLPVSLWGSTRLLHDKVEVPAQSFLRRRIGGPPTDLRRQQRLSVGTRVDTKESVS